MKTKTAIAWATMAASRKFAAQSLPKKSYL